MDRGERREMSLAAIAGGSRWDRENRERREEVWPLRIQGSGDGMEERRDERVDGQRPWSVGRIRLRKKTTWDCGPGPAPA